MALRGGRVEDGRARGPALLGAIVGTRGVVGALTFRDGLEDVRARHALAGTTWDHVVNLPYEGELPPLSGVVGLRAAAAVVRAQVEVGGEAGGDAVSAWSYDPRAGEVRRVVFDGRLPSGPDEAALGPDTARRLGLEVGDELTFSTGAAMTVVGVALLPEEPGHSAYDQGMWLTPEGLADVGPTEVANRELLAVLEPGPGPRAALAEALAPLFGEAEPVEIEPARRPATARSLVSVRQLPLVLAVFLAMLAAGMCAHALGLGVRRRHRDLAVLRALGGTRALVRLVVASQATTIGLAGLAVGVPLGLVAGRAAWQEVAESLPIVYDAPLAGVALALCVPAALALANLAAARPARRAVRHEPGEVLRAE
jgi:hypothetical protein